jgi:hypothetical protein
MKLKSALIGLLTLGAIASVPQSASAFPNGLTQTDQISNVEQVRWVCNPRGRCWWRPNYYGSYGFYPAPFFVHPYRGWHYRGWRRW